MAQRQYTLAEIDAMRHSFKARAFEERESSDTSGDMDRRAERELRTAMTAGIDPKEITDLFPCNEHGFHEIRE